MTPDLLYLWGGGVMFMMALAALVRIAGSFIPDDFDDDRNMRGAASVTLIMLWGMMFVSMSVGGTPS